MATLEEIRETDAKGRLTLPRGFANSTVLIRVVNDVEIVIRKAKVVPLKPADERFVEEEPIVLSGADRDFILDLLDNPPPPNEKLRKLMAKSKANVKSDI